MLFCAILGLAMANIEPILISNVGRQTPHNPGMAIATVCSMGDAGLLTGPALIGFIAQYHGLKRSLDLLPGGALILILESLIMTGGEQSAKCSFIIEEFDIQKSQALLGQYEAQDV
eukprot:Blabericola_migrator_1__4218@NODE_2294_length_2988_cov_75_294420_g298_i10_p2_GENE_NODE_2294_length_2988_cov_75_294420_g298_i10NODE_2294_length_2988_cov_75_294420_g298_i10_p2_ORF_typecomplete_len116_score14_16MFS_1/PF07690_16/0_00064MFS_4/PF06779_14/0_013_NODE_2294_length_2988_cov_75_294420_g298_i109821329